MLWSTDQILELTRKRCIDAGVQWSELPIRNDIDTYEDLQRFLNVSRHNEALSIIDGLELSD